jgi:3-dehydroquinate synthase
MQKVSVSTGNPYEITIGVNLDFGKLLKPFIQTNAILIYDFNLPQNKLIEIKESFRRHSIEFSTLELQTIGESIKTFSNFESVSKQLIENHNTTRKTTLVAIGGGTVGDFVGFVASSFMRGIPFIQVPTTLLSMVDSSVGGKVAINLEHYKNCIGAFYQPKHVLIDVSFLQTLPVVELISGYAEVLKYGFIASREFYNYLLKNSEIFNKVASLGGNNVFEEQTQEYLISIILESCKIKASVVTQDETETNGIREILNFGHTFGHAFEGLYMGKLPHGIAVGIGMILALEYSKINTEEVLEHYKTIGLYSSITQYCTKHNLPLPSVEEIFALMKKDKKNTNTNIKLILLKEIGIAVVTEEKQESIKKILELNLKI